MESIEQVSPFASHVELLKTVSLFKGIQDAGLLALLPCLGARIGHYEKGQTVFSFGEQIDHFGIVLTGQVQVVQDDYYGNRSILSVIGPADLFGESFACAETRKLTVSVLATADCDLLFIDCRKLAMPCSLVCSYHGSLIHNMLQIVSQKNIALTQKIECTSKRTTREKVLAYLSLEAKKSGGGEFTIPFNRQQLADYLAVDRSGLSVELSKLSHEGILTSTKNHFELH
ncbi:MAG: Crp/Fnr family transcriptional regulator [Eubacteriales bacterium]|nr:Crp/Fnr family transcriptional regulator [Eubacteriales bacterium]